MLLKSYKKYHLAKRVVFDKYIIPSCNCKEGKGMNLSRNRWYCYCSGCNRSCVKWRLERHLEKCSKLYHL